MATICLVRGHPTALAAEGVTFLDERPVVIDLAVAEVGDEWSVEVVAPLQDGVDAVAVTAVMSPPILTTSPPEGPPRAVSPMVGLVEFRIRLDTEQASSGALILSDADGVLARRPVRILTAGTNLAVPEALGGRGVRTHPFGGDVSIRPVEFPNADVPAPRVIGRLTNGSDSAQVIQTQEHLVFEGIETTGRYQGVADLAPGLEGGDTKMEVTVRDQVMWPLVTLTTGLVFVSVLDVGRRRRRPERVLALQLQRLVDRAAAYQGRTGVSLRVTGSRLEPLVLDELKALALTEFRTAVDDETLRAWAPGGEKLGELSGHVDRFVELCERQQELSGQLVALLAQVPMARRAGVEAALARSAVGRALAPTAVRTLVGLKTEGDALEAASQFLAASSAIVERLVSALPGPDSARASVLLDRLVADPDQLPNIAEEAQQLRLPPPVAAGVANRAEPLRPEAARSPGKDSVGTRTPQSETAPAAGKKLGSSLRVAIIAVAAAALALGVAILSAIQAPSYIVDAVVAGGGGDGSETGVLPAPTEADLAPVGNLSDSPQLGAFLGPGAIAAALLAATVGIAWLALRQRPTGHSHERSAVELERELRRSDRTLSLLSGVLVVLSGLVTLYVPNASFGTAGDYLSALLWGTTLSAGIELARRFGNQSIVA